MPDIGHVPAAGKTAGEVQNEIYNLYVPKIYRHVTVTVNTGDRVYYVMGEVKQPGRQLYTGQMTVTKANGDGADAHGLGRAMRPVWLPKVSKGFFFRAESFFNFATEKSSGSMSRTTFSRGGAVGAACAGRRAVDATS